MVTKPKQTARAKSKPWPDEGPCVQCKGEVSGKHFHLKAWKPRAQEVQEWGPICSPKCLSDLAGKIAKR